MHLRESFCFSQIDEFRLVLNDWILLIEITNLKAVKMNINTVILTLSFCLVV